MESKIVLTKNWQARGLWGEVSSYMDDERRRLRFEGLGRRESNDKAWELAAEKYSIAPGQEERVIDVEIPPVSNTINLKADVVWVYQRLAIDSVRASDAPNAGCWNLLWLARRNQQWFYKSLLPRVLSMRERVPQEIDSNDKKIETKEDDSIDLGVELRAMVMRTREDIDTVSDENNC